MKNLFMRFLLAICFVFFAVFSIVTNIVTTVLMIVATIIDRDMLIDMVCNFSNSCMEISYKYMRWYARKLILYS